MTLCNKLRWVDKFNKFLKPLCVWVGVRISLQQDFTITAAVTVLSTNISECGVAEEDLLCWSNHKAHKKSTLLALKLYLSIQIFLSWSSLAQLSRHGIVVLLLFSSCHNHRKKNRLSFSFIFLILHEVFNVQVKNGMKASISQWIKQEVVSCSFTSY